MGSVPSHAGSPQPCLHVCKYKISFFFNTSLLSGLRVPSGPCGDLAHTDREGMRTEQVKGGAEPKVPKL